jgi:hypothetical protein
VHSLLVAYVLRAGHDQRIKERRRSKKPAAEKGPSKVEQLLGRGSARVTFSRGVVLTLPGVSYLVALHDLQQLGYGTVAEIAVIGLFLVARGVVGGTHRNRDAPLFRQPSTFGGGSDVERRGPPKPPFREENRCFCPVNFPGLVGVWERRLEEIASSVLEA